MRRLGDRQEDESFAMWFLFSWNRWIATIYLVYIAVYAGVSLMTPWYIFLFVIYALIIFVYSWTRHFKYQSDSLDSERKE